MYYSLRSENGTREILRYMQFEAVNVEHEGSAYDCHIYPEITHFVGVEGVLDIEGRLYDVKAGDIFLFRSNEKHRIIKVTKTGLIENMNFEPMFVSQGGDGFELNYLSVFTCQGNFENRLDTSNPATREIRKLLSEIGREFTEEKFGYAHMIKMHLFTLILSLIRDFNYPATENALTPPHVDAIRNSMRYIDENLSENLTLPYLASLVSFSTNYYGTLFKQINGFTPIEYITSKRIQKAICLLPEFEGTMLELALVCGFNNTANFNRAFRSYTGQVPSKYKPPTI